MYTNSVETHRIAHAYVHRHPKGVLGRLVGHWNMARVLKWSKRKQLPQILKCELTNTVQAQAESTLLVCAVERETLGEAPGNP